MIIKTYVTHPGEHCYFANISNILMFYNTGIDENILAIIGDGLNCEYNVKSVDGTFRMFLGLPNDKLISNAFSKLNVYFQKVIIKDEKDAWDFTASSLCKEIPLLIMVDTQYLKYSSIFNETISRDHYIVIYGIDEKYAYISDPYVLTNPKSYYHGPTSIESIKLARSSKNNECIIFDISNYKSIENKYILRQLHDTIANNLYDNKNDMSGIAGIRRFSEDILNLKDFFKDMFITEVTNLAFYLKVSGLISRFVYLRNILKNKKIFTCDEKEFVEQLNYICTEWNKVILLLLKCGLKYSDKQVRAIRDKINILANAEEKLMKRLKETIKGLL